MPRPRTKAPEKTVQELMLEKEGLREELEEILQVTACCRFCKFQDADCVRHTMTCSLVWRGARK